MNDYDKIMSMILIINESIIVVVIMIDHSNSQTQCVACFFLMLSQ